MEREALKLALEALTIQSDRVTEIGKKREAITAIKEALAQPAQEPVAFEEWLSKQHGDPEEIGFLQALRIAYISGQDSIITPPQRKPLTDAQGNECGMCGYVGKDKDKTGQCPKCRWDELRPLTGKAHQKPLTDDQIYEMYNEPRSDAEMLEFARAIEAAHGIKGEA
ncbi:hypothetical protein UFOVP376_26 [uncultured Caudovirales phage]|uniref:Uncharacterized protein n=1 Tax=uncultured Caudovirales phage TaxID=2100421 RepID=A0A6J7WYD2_9CAUD|nr:hypothetical protein UFOVP376_26 [uncultured Caudovirales phage]